jgi:hypothetical protein
MEQFLASASRDNRPAQRRAFVDDFGGTIHGLTGWDGFVGKGSICHVKSLVAWVFDPWQKKKAKSVK